jgi:hypothetical protein
MQQAGREGRGTKKVQGLGLDERTGPGAAIQSEGKRFGYARRALEDEARRESRRVEGIVVFGRQVSWLKP